MNNLWSQKCCELRSHSQYNLKLSVSTSLEQRKNVFRREKCFWCPSYSWHRIVSANKTANKLLRQVSNDRYRHQIPKILFLIIYIYTASWSCRVVDLKLPSNFRHKLPYKGLRHRSKHRILITLGALRCWQRTTSTLKHHGTLWTTKCKSFPSKNSFVYMLSFLHLYFYVDSWCLTNLHIHMSILLTVVTRTTTENPVFMSLKQIKNGSVQNNYAMLNWIDNF